MNILTNAFSLNMIEATDSVTLRVNPIMPEEVPADCKSAIGHADTARVVSGILGREVPANRATVTLRRDENVVLYVAQYRGPRLPEGATTLPEGAELRFYRVYIVK